MSYLKTFLFRHSFLLIFLSITSIVASLMEGLGLGLVLPLFEGVKGQAILNIPFPFDYISNFFSNLEITQRIWLIAVLLVIITVIKGVMLYFSFVLSSRLQARAIKYYWMLCFKQLIKLGIGYIQNRRIAHLQAVAVTHVQNIGRFMASLGGLVPQFFTVFLLFGMLILMSWRLTLITIVIFAATALISQRLAHRSEKFGKDLVESDKEIHRFVLDAIAGMKIIRLFRQQGNAIKKLNDEINKYNVGLAKMAQIKAIIQPILETLGVASLSIILVVSSVFILKNGEGLEIILAFILICFRLITPLTALNRVGVTIAGDLPYFREIHQFLDPNEKPYIKSGAKNIVSFSQSIEFQNVSFAYNQQNASVLHNISFKINKGDKIGIVGASGSGKSTITELLLRFYDPQNGKIIIDGIDLRDLDLSSWHKCIGVVTQDTFLFFDNICNNIAFAKPNASEEEIIQAAKRAYADEFIRGLPNGYDTIIGDRGVLLSGGERQRLAIARAILSNPEILIFDEATSALDSESERIVQEAIQRISEGKTVIAIAHRLATLTNFDKIIILDKGLIIDSGSHQDLMRQSELYRKFVNMQMLKNDEI
ncbi:MAG: ABC transporter ATP-binding protein [bacterium]|nr:ABC transporter ATP-binding protein [bacterium]